jgi:hypothetical protein
VFCRVTNDLAVRPRRGDFRLHFPFCGRRGQIVLDICRTVVTHRFVVDGADVVDMV